MATDLMDDLGYFDNLFGQSQMRRVFGDRHRMACWLAFEVALARAQARVGVIPEVMADRIADAAKLENLDLAALKADFDRIGFPVIPLVRQLAKACDAEAARWVHWGSTSQDVQDTGMVLQIRDALDLIDADLRVITNELARLAHTHRGTVMAGRSFQQHAAPITFGYKVAVWLDEMLRHRERLAEIRKRVLVGQCGGAVGTLATLGDRGLDVRHELMAELDLGEPAIAWHTARDGLAELVFWLAMVAATLGKVATEVAILMRSEVNEVREPFEPGRGSSSTMPQKRNPVFCEPIIAIAHRMRETVGSQLIAMIQEHERGVGPMHLEWIVIPEAFVLTSGALAHTKTLLTGLIVDEEQMRSNLQAGGGFIMAEAVMMGLAPKIGRMLAHELVQDVANHAMEKGMTLREGLLEERKVTAVLNEAEIDRLLEPGNYTGSAAAMVDTVLARVRDADTMP